MDHDLEHDLEHDGFAILSSALLAEQVASALRDASAALARQAAADGSIRGEAEVYCSRSGRASWTWRACRDCAMP